MKLLSSKLLEILCFCFGALILSSIVEASTSKQIRPRILQLNGSPSPDKKNSSSIPSEAQNTVKSGQNSSSSVHMGVWIGVGCGILGFFGLLIYLLSKRQPQVGNATNPQSPAVAAEPVPQPEESARNSAQDETDPNPVQAFPTFSLDAMLSFDRETLQNIGHIAVGMPMATRYFTYPRVVQVGLQPTESQGTNQIQAEMMGDYQNSHPPSMEGFSSSSQLLQTRARLPKSRIKRSKNAVPTLVTLNLGTWESAATLVQVAPQNSTVQAVGSTFRPRPEQSPEFSRVQGSESAHGGNNHYTGAESPKAIQRSLSNTTTTWLDRDPSENYLLPENVFYKPYKIPTHLQEGVDPESISTESIRCEHDASESTSKTRLKVQSPDKRLESKRWPTPDKHRGQAGTAQNSTP